MSVPNEELGPTPYPYVNKVLLALLAEVRGILGAQFYGLYLYGSLASGDFYPRRSDIDFLVVTESELGEETVAALGEMHARLWANGGKWAQKLEGAYVPRQLLDRYKPNGPKVPAVNEGKFYQEALGSDWVIQYYILREHSTTVEGPDLKALIAPVSTEALRQAVVKVLDEWWEPMLSDHHWLERSEYQAYAVLTMCRALHTLQEGEMISKSAAARWARRALDEKWKKLIDWAEEWPIDQSDRLEETLELIRYTLEVRKRQVNPSMPNYYSQNGEDFILERLLNHIQQGFFVEVGCIDGKRFSNTLTFEERGWKGICVEAHAGYIELLKKNRPGSIVCHCAAGEVDDNDVAFFANDRGSLSTLDAAKEADFRKNYPDYFSGFSEQRVQKKRLDTIFKQNHVSDITLLSVDVEGYEIQVLQGIDFELYKPYVIAVESEDRDHEEQLDHLLIPHGYTKIFRLVENIFYALDGTLRENVLNKTFTFTLTHTKHPLDEGEDRVFEKVIDTHPANLPKRMLRRLRRLAKVS